MRNFFAELLEQLQAGHKVVAARIIRQSGSAPRSIGTRCIIREDGSLLGTIGGGLLEFQVMEAAKAALVDERTSILNFQLTGMEVAQTDMICGGKMDVYLEPVDPGNKTAIDVFEAAAKAIDTGHRGTLITLISEGISSKDKSCRIYIAEDGSSTGFINKISQMNRQELEPLCQTRDSALTELDAGGTLAFSEAVRPDDILYLFGAGHVSTCIAPLAKLVGFRVVVIDDRKEFANKDRFPGADEIITLPFSKVFEHITVTDLSYLVIVTRGHISDKDVLQGALQKSNGYIGMIGSRRKRDLIYRSLIEEGFSEERLKAVHSPIGLEIGAETPEEIAVSIVGELIQKRAGKG